MKIQIEYLFVAGTLVLGILLTVMPVSAVFTFDSGGSGTYYLGEDITFSGITDETNSVYLFLSGPNLPAAGAQIASIDPANNSVTNLDAATFLVVDVPAGNQWDWTWSTKSIGLVPGTYTVYAVIEPNDKNNLAGVTYGTKSIIVKKPIPPYLIETPGIRVYIGEQGLDITRALNRAYGNPNWDGYPAPAQIAWWAPASPFTNPPDKVIDVSGTYNNFYIAPSEFVGYEGNWYAMNWSLFGTPGYTPNATFYVWDPALEMQILDINNVPISDFSSVSRGSRLRFSIHTNLFAATTQRPGGSPLGYIDIRVRDPTNQIHNSLYLYNTSPAVGYPPHSLTSIVTDNWTEWWPDFPFFTEGWQTDTIYNNEYVYPAGTYEIWAESSLNNMKDNYKNAGADYQGKTVSSHHTITLNDPAPPVTAVEAYNAVKAFLGVDETKVTVYAPVLLPEKSAIKNWQKLVINLPDYRGYLIFIDDYPEANWEHPCTYAYVKADDKSVITTYVDRTPAINLALAKYAGLFAKAGGTGKYDLLSYSASSTMAPVPEEAGAGACTPDSSKYYALLIAGGFTPEYNHVRYYNDIKYMYESLTKSYGYPANHIWVLMSDGGEPANDQHYSDITTTTPVTPVLKNSDMTPFAGSTVRKARKTTLISTLDLIKTNLTSSDNLFIFMTNHGGTTTPVSKEAFLYLWEGDTISDTEFTNYINSKVGHASSIAITMEQCYSGGFIDNIIPASYALTQKRVITTAADWDEFSYGNAFSAPWIRGVASPFPADTYNPGGSQDWRTSLREAFTYAVDRDPYKDGRETPQLAATPNTDASTRFLGDCSATPSPTITVISPNTAGEIYYVGCPLQVSWEQNGFSNKPVNVELWKGSTAPTKIQLLATATTPQTLGSASLTLPPLAAGKDYWINVTLAENNLIADRSNANFEIRAKAAGGKIQVTSSPAGADIYHATGGQILTMPLEGFYTPSGRITTLTGTAGTIFYPVCPGVNTIGVSLDNYYEQTATNKDVKPGLSTPWKVDFKLKQIDPNDCTPFAKLFITSTPVDDARIYIDGVYEGMTDKQIGLYEGTYTVSVERDGYISPAPKQVTIPPRQCGGPERISYAEFELVKADVNIPEFPSAILSAVFIIGFLGAVLYIRHTRNS